MIKPVLNKKKNGIPVLSREEIDIVAERYISDFCPEMLDNPAALDIDDMMGDYFEVPMDTKYLCDDGSVLGLTVFSDMFIPILTDGEYEKYYVSAPLVIIDRGLWKDENNKGRLRFTQAHETAHFIMHGDYYRQLKDCCPCRSASIDRSYTTGIRGDYEWTEWQANVFASSLLLPRKSVLKLYERYADVDYFDMRIALTVAAMEFTFEVSEQAAIIRLRELGIIPKRYVPDYGEIWFFKKYSSGFRLKRK